MDAAQFLKEFHDHAAPLLDSYEQSIYLYIVRHSRLEGREEVTIGFKSARKLIAMGLGKSGHISDRVCYTKLQSLQDKQFIRVLGTEWEGTRVRASLPSEIPGLLSIEPDPTTLPLEELDFFNVVQNRPLIREREDNRCFYCLAGLNDKNWVVEHVVSRPEGNSTYRNVVAACRRCNNRKGTFVADDFLRTLYRDGYLNADDLQDRLSHLERLSSGELKPRIAG